MSRPRKTTLSCSVGCLWSGRVGSKPSAMSQEDVRLSDVRFDVRSAPQFLEVVLAFWDVSLCGAASAWASRRAHRELFLRAEKSLNEEFDMDVARELVEADWCATGHACM